jgi:methyl acetate hydrolase
MTDTNDAMLAAWSKGALPGVVAGVLRRGEQPVFSSRGERGPDAGPMTTDTVFRIASMTKPVTAVAAMQLAEAGRIGLDDPLGPLVPVLAKAQVLDRSGPQPRLRAPKRPITLRHLLTHTSGFAYGFWNEALLAHIAATGAPSIGGGLLAELDLPLMFDPGEAWEYGIGIDWAGQVVEAVSGQPFDAYLAQHVFDPLGMADTAFRPNAAMAKRLASPFMRLPTGDLEPMPQQPPPEGRPEYFSGGGGLSSTVPDYLRFLGAILGGGSFDGARILRPETLEVMSRDHLGGVPIRRLPTAMPFATHDLDLAGGAPAHWGLSWQINPEPGPNGRSPGSLAWAGLFNTYFWADPAAGVAGVVMSQFFPFGDPKMMELFAAFERSVYARA